MTDYNKLTVVNLKALLKDRGIPQTGLTRKAQYVEALEKADAADDGPEDAPDASQDEGQDKDEIDAQEDGSKAETQDEGTLPEAETVDQPSEQDAPTAIGAAEELEQGEKQQMPEDKADKIPDAKPAPAEMVETRPTVEPAAVPETTASNAAPADLTQTSTMESVKTEELMEDRMKRKRRSATPSISEDTVKKKLRYDQDDGVVHLKEDTPEAGNVESKEPMDTDKKAEDDEPRKEKSDAPLDAQDGTASRSTAAHLKSTAAPREREGRYKDLLPPSEATSTLDQDPMETDERATAPAMHPATSAIYISNLQRPLNPQSLRSRLVALAAPPNEAPDPAIINAFYVDSIKSHAFARFGSLTAASRVRASLHDRAWPAERDRKPLWIDFIPEEKCEEWIEFETDNSKGMRSAATRWEVSYDADEDGVTARLVEFGTTAGARGAGQAARRDIGDSNGHTTQETIGRRSSAAATTAEPAKATAPPLSEGEAQKFINLDKLFESTSAKPKLYFLPVARDVADKRLDELSRTVSRKWASNRISDADNEQLRRYTFEDGDMLVDSGFHPIPGRGRGGFGGRPSRRGGSGRDDGGYGSYRPR